MPRPRLVLIVVVTCLLGAALQAPAAGAADRYASPGGAGTTCTQLSPCSLQTAVTGATGGDDVILLPSSTAYTLPDGEFLSVPANVDVRGQDGQPRPTIVSNFVFPPLDAGGVGVTLRHLRIENTGWAVYLNQGLVVRDVIGVSSATSPACNWGGTGTLTDSVCWHSAANGTGTGSNLSGGTVTATMRNVTAVGGNRGMSFSVNGGSTASTVDGKNVIAYAVNPGEYDIQANASGGTNSMTITMAYSNYSNELEIGTTGGTATITNPGTNNNQTALPQFVDLATGDFHQASGSPTINAGTADAANGPTDFDVEPRSLGTGPDIGADELGAFPVAVADSATVGEDSSPTGIDVLANDTDTDGGDKQVTSTTDPPNGTAAITGGGSGVQYQPDPDDCGPDSFDYTLNGGSTATVSVTVTCVDDSPVAQDDSPTVAEDAPAAILNVRANDTDVDSGPKAVQSTTSPAHGTAQISGGDVSYQPAANYCGPDSFDYTLNGNSTATVSITVTCVDDAPTAVADSATIAQDAAATAIPVLANDTDVDGGTKTVASRTDPAHGTAAITGGGSGVTYQPAAGYCGSDSFTYSLNGGSTAAVSITVTCAPDRLAPRTSLRGKPPKTTRKRKAMFRFTSNEAGSTFLCKLDRKRFRACRSPVIFTVRPGKHVLRVKAVDPAGNADPTPAVYRWKVLPPLA